MVTGWDSRPFSRPLVQPVLSARPELPALTGARAIAALAVVSLHCRALGVVGFAWAPDEFNQAVSFFFLLSGFILAYTYDGRAEVGLGDFLRARVARLWPVMAVALVFSVAVQWPDFRAAAALGGFANRWRVIAAHLLLVQAWVPIWHYQLSWNPPAWSISCEWFFYLCFPFLLNRRKFAFRTVFACGLAVVVWLAAARWYAVPSSALRVGEDGLASFFPATRLCEFTLGIVGYRWWRLHPRAMVGIRGELVAVGMLALWIAFGLPAMRAAVPPGFAASWFIVAGAAPVFLLFVLAFADGHGPVGLALATPAMRWLGQSSFSLYMIHAPLLFLFRKLELVGFPFVVLGGILGVAALVHHVVEQPARAWLAGRHRPVDAGHIRGVCAPREATAGL